MTSIGWKKCRRSNFVMVSYACAPITRIRQFLLMWFPLTLFNHIFKSWVIFISWVGYYSQTYTNFDQHSSFQEPKCSWIGGGRLIMDIKGKFSWTKWVNSCGHFEFWWIHFVHEKSSSWVNFSWTFLGEFLVTFRGHFFNSNEKRYIISKQPNLTQI